MTPGRNRPPLSSRIWTWLEETLGEIPATIISIFLLTVLTVNLTLIILLVWWVQSLVHMLHWY